MFFPVYTKPGVITIIYSVVIPLVLVVSIGAFVSFWAVQRKRLIHLLLGLYFLELKLFFLARDEKGNATCIGQGVTMVVIAALTAVHHVFLARAYGTLINTVTVMH